MTLKRPAIFLLLIPLSAFSQRKDPALYRGTDATLPKSQPPGRGLSLPRLAPVALGALSADERAKLGAVGMMRRVGIHRALPGNALANGSWSALTDGHSVWRLQIQSDQATGMRVEFSNFNAGSGQVWVYSNASVDGPYTGRGPYGNGEFWSATIAGDTATVEYEPANPLLRGAVPFHVHRVSHQEFRASDAVLPPADGAASCNLDVNCYADWQDAKKSVAQIEFEETQGSEQGTFLCSASLVGTRDNSFKPYLLTAGHCVHDEAAARSLETFWSYESAGCNLGPPADRGTSNSQNGGHLLAWGSIEQGDYSLVLLPNVPPGVVFSGWDTSDPALGSPLVGIHHPKGSYKRISFGSSIASLDADIGGDRAPAGLYHDVLWTNGLTEPGSSGSPLFSAPGVIVGMLTYGPDVPGEELCVLGGLGGYGKFSNAYRYLQAYLEDFPFSQITASADSLQFNGRNHAIVGSASQTFALSVQTGSAVQWAARADAPWIQLSQSSGTVSSSLPASITVSVNPKYFLASDTYTSTVTILSGAAPPVYVNVSVKMAIDTSNVVVTATPNPVTQNGGSWALTLNLQETAGADTKLTALKIDGADYSANIAAWFGSGSIPANGAISASIHTSGLVTPVTKYFEFYGQDAGSGRAWYRQLTVTFTE